MDDLVMTRPPRSERRLVAKFVRNLVSKACVQLLHEELGQVPMEVLLAEQLRAGASVFCPQCQVLLNSPSQWQEHRRGKKHRQSVRCSWKARNPMVPTGVVAGKERMRNPVPPKLRTMEGFSEFCGFTGSDLLSSSGLSEDSVAAEEDDDGWSGPASDDEPPPKVARSSMWWRRATACAGDGTWRAQGSRLCWRRQPDMGDHGIPRKVFQALNHMVHNRDYMARIGISGVTGESADVPGILSIDRSDDGQIYCPDCRVYLTGVSQWQGHVDGKKHRKCVLRIQRQFDKSIAKVLEPRGAEAWADWADANDKREP